jgi:hypothetical protein
MGGPDTGQTVPPPQPSPLPGAPLPPVPPSPASPTFVAATGPRDPWFDAFRSDERSNIISKSAHPVHSFYSVFTSFSGARSSRNGPITPPASAAYRSYDTGHVLTENRMEKNPLPSLAKILPQKFDDLSDKSASARKQYDGLGAYCIYVPVALQSAFKAQSATAKPKARICLHFGSWYDLNMLGLRSFFQATKDSVLITVPGVATSVQQINMNNDWGVGITTAMIRQLLEDAGLKGIEFTIEVLTCWSTGYRGFNETIINELVDLKAVKRLVYLNAFNQHDDFPLPKRDHPFYKKNTLWAADTALKASSSAEIAIYAYSDEGVPRSDGKGTPEGPLQEFKQKFGSQVRFIELEFDQSGKPKKLNELENICLARVVQSGLDDYYEEKDVFRVSPDILPLVNLLPPRGSLGVLGRRGYTDLFDWITRAPQKDAIAKFPAAKAFAMIKKFKLEPKPTERTQYAFRNYQFIPEIGKECLLP